MDEKGVTGVAVLWVLAAISAIAFSALAVGYRSRAQARARLADVKALYLAYAGVSAARLVGFDFTERTYDFPTGSVRVERVLSSGGSDVVRLRCIARCDDFTKNVEIVWKKMGNVWRAMQWKEIS